MSLHNLAHHLQSAGRGEDKVLVHMTPKEVQGLQSLAMAHGGSLTVNPETGLPEAGFLSSLLPMAIGFGLAPFTGGLSAALITGAGYTAATGSLRQGLMAGLGAYGGAGLAQGLSAMGSAAVPTTSAATSASVPTSVQSTLGDVATQGGRLGGVGGVNVTTNPFTVPSEMAGKYVPAAPSPTPSVTPTPTPTTPPVPGVDRFAAATPNANLTAPGQPLYQPVQSQMNLASNAPAPRVETLTGPSRVVEVANPSAVDFNKVTNYRIDPFGNVVDPTRLSTTTQTVPGYTQGTSTTSQPFARGLQTPPPSAVTTTTPDPTTSSPITQGLKTSFRSTEGLKGLYNAMPDYSVTALGVSLADAARPEAPKPKKDEALVRPYEFSYNPTGVDTEPYTGSAERTYFQPQFTALTPYTAPGPEYEKEKTDKGFAVGGPVETMSAANAVGQNLGYPQAGYQTPMYSNPSIQRPFAQNVIAPSGDVGVDAYTGEQRFAEGGIPDKMLASSPGYKYEYDPKTQRFTEVSAPVFIPAERIGMYNASIAPARWETQRTGIVSGGIAPLVNTPKYTPYASLGNTSQTPSYMMPAQQNMGQQQQPGLGSFYDTMDARLTAMGYAEGGGISHLGDYSDGGRLLKGPGDGVSDSIPASIGGRQPARLADGEFVVPARIVSEIGNGSTEAGARKLYAMMDRVQKARRKTVGKDQVAKNTKAERLLPA